MNFGLLNIYYFKGRQDTEGQNESSCKIRHISSNHCLDVAIYEDFKDDVHPVSTILNFYELKILSADRVSRVSMHHQAKFHGGRSPSWISYMVVWSTHEEYLVVFIVVQNLVQIGAVVSITCHF